MTSSRSKLATVWFRGLVLSVILTVVIFFMFRIDKDKMNGPQRISLGRELLNYMDNPKNNSDENSGGFLNTTVAEDLKKKVRILCIILTTDASFQTKGAAVKVTWARRCNKYFFVLKTNILEPEIINFPGDETRMTLIHKVKYALRHIYDNYIDDFDWIIKADDDTYVILENLRYLLQFYDSKKPGYIGYHFNMFVENGYMSGGAGYVISNHGLRRLVELGFDTGSCPIVPDVNDPENSEDVNIGRCLNVTGVPVLSSLDVMNRETFHPYPVERHLFGPLHEYLKVWSMNTPQKGPACCSRFSISFHYMEPKAMLLLDHLLYRISVYGRTISIESSNNASLKPFLIKPVQNKPHNHWDFNT